MSKTADFYTEIFEDLLSAEVSMSAYASMRKAARNLLKALDLEKEYEDFKEANE